MQQYGKLRLESGLASIFTYYNKITDGARQPAVLHSFSCLSYNGSKKIVEHWTVRCRNWDVNAEMILQVFADKKMQENSGERLSENIVLSLLKQGVNDMLLLFHEFLTFLEPVALTLYVDDRGVVQNTVKDC
jgi:hypothetical protein